MAKHVYFFGGKTADGNGKMKDLLGGKGANLAEMCLIGLPVPAGFTITTEVCNYFTAHNKTYSAGLEEEIRAAMKKTEEVMGAKFGDAKNPLLVSCRSGELPPFALQRWVSAIGSPPCCRSGRGSTGLACPDNRVSIRRVHPVLETQAGNLLEIAAIGSK